ncbi:DUF1294 domain-containing protein [Alcaligenaceae bacterium C4P045]|nr:DUF1294 domain-containing protein [Alcaligenaceae bacterium C4P045]
MDPAGFILVFVLLTLVGSAYLAMSAITFVAYGRDKSASRRGAWRTRESTLHLPALLGG